ncbi:hypothetical protein [Oryzihumus leptocrescens]|uniref:hypothetical protein n=1 Tax=Oryzihumus leptocrescens TaxID=297536 RepID=UPI0011517D61|nr:hypothetical protein [Oryzihumus leptocrescens]
MSSNAPVDGDFILTLASQTGDIRILPAAAGPGIADGGTWWAGSEPPLWSADKVAVDGSSSTDVRLTPISQEGAVRVVQALRDHPLADPLPGEILWVRSSAGMHPDQVLVHIRDGRVTWSWMEPDGGVGEGHGGSGGAA